jgi:hypothetical protein
LVSESSTLVSGVQPELQQGRGCQKRDVTAGGLNFGEFAVPTARDFTSGTVGSRSRGYRWPALSEAPTRAFENRGPGGRLLTLIVSGISVTGIVRSGAAVALIAVPVTIVARSIAAVWHVIATVGV